VTKKRIMIMAAAGLVSFAGAFGLAWLTKKPPVSPQTEPDKQATVGEEIEPNLPLPRIQIASAAGTADSTTKRTMTEQQLNSLVYEVREKMQEYNNKLQSLETREQRLQTAQQTLKKEIENLNNLRVELASIVVSLKEERDRLRNSRLEIAKAEQANLTKVAATYDKMDAASASKIVSSMCTSKTQAGRTASDASDMDDAVKILHYMTERTKAKLLAELATSEPKLAAALSNRLRQVVERQ
jgi:flagellar motility protein MotE (MotC chaperone)